MPSLTSLNGHTLIAMDGTQYFASNKLSCRNCSTADTPMARSTIFTRSWPPASSNPARIGFCLYGRNSSNRSKGTTSKTARSRALRRWLELNAARYSRLDPVYLGDDIYSKQPVCEAVRAVGAHFLFVCKPDSHKTTYEYLIGVEVPSLSKTVKRGKKRFTYTWRWMQGVPIRDGKDALDVNWLEIVIRDCNDKITYRNSFITDLPVDADTAETSPPQEGRGGRSRTRHSTPSNTKGTISSTILATGKTTYRRSSQRSI